MKYGSLRVKLLHLLFSLGCLICLFAFVRLSFPIAFGGASTATNNYLQVRAADFTSDGYENLLKYYQISLQANVDLPQEENSYERYGLTDENDNTFALYDQDGNALNIYCISASEKRTNLLIVLYKKADGEKVGYSDDLEKIVVKKEAKLLSPSDYTGTYAGIQFAEEMTLIKTDEGWSVVQNGQTEQTENYEVALTKDNLSVFLENDLLKAQINVPFSRETDVEYTPSLKAYRNGLAEEFRAVQYANESKITLLFENYIEESENIPSLSLQGGDLTDSAKNTIVTCSGNITFYEYVDETWATEKYICVKEIVNGRTEERKTPATETYTFTTPEVETDKLWLGWKHEGKLYQAGDFVALAEYEKRTFQTETVFVGYGLIEGASIRYDRTGETSGIRFASQLNLDDFNAHKDVILGVGIILMPNNLLGEKEFTLENYSGAGQAKSVFIESDEIVAENGDIFTLYASIVKVLEINYNRTFSARAYILTDDGDEGVYVWDSPIVSRSVYYVASAALEKDKHDQALENWQKTILETYVNGVANITFENGVTSILSQADISVIESAETESNGNEIVIRLTTKRQKFSGITYNGKRVKNAVQTYINGVLTIAFSLDDLETVR